MTDGRKSARQRMDPTALHVLELSASNTAGVIKLDIVAQVVTVQYTAAAFTPSAIEGSLDGVNFFSLGSPSGGLLTYGKDAAHHLVKHVRVTRSSGAGKVGIFAK
jgi:hypothetical protein